MAPLSLTVAVCLLAATADAARVRGSDSCAKDYPGATADERCTAMVHQLQGEYSVLVNATLSLSAKSIPGTSKRPSTCEEINEELRKLEAAEERCARPEEIRTCWKDLQETLPTFKKHMEEEKAKHGC